MKDSFCIHGHFYQPPRDNPFTGEIPQEYGAAPFNNWNEKISSECYQPNAQLGNFEKISFDIGPSLVKWLEDFDRETLVQIVEQDQRNFQRYGVGNAMAQAYSHRILPLSSRLDKITQIRWGVVDFVHTYSHNPSGMWLPETAVDLETLEIMADHGIEFTILAPWQAKKLASTGAGAYRVKLRNQKSIAVFFYDRPLSDDVSFHSRVTENADTFVADRLRPRMQAVVGNSLNEKMVLLASDGEAYGHHQKFRDKFLSQLLNGATMYEPYGRTYPGLWLKEHTVPDTTEIVENTSWSCHHGVERWGGFCNCTPHAEWKKPFKKAMDRLAADLDRIFELTLAPYFSDPWELRHGYIHVLRKHVTMEEFIQSQSATELPSAIIAQIGLLLLSQFERQRMFTSCGWFFEDFDSIEPKNNVAYAAYAVQLCLLATGNDLTEKAKKYFASVVSFNTGLRADQVFLEQMEHARIQTS